MSELIVKLITNSSTITLDKAVRFSYEKERYTPYSLLEGEFISDVAAGNVKEVQLFYGVRQIHRGFPDVVRSRFENGVTKLYLRSYGYSMLLGQNEAEPGLITSPNLSTVTSGIRSIRGVTVQGDTDTVNYVYFGEHTSLWEAACIYTFKAYDTHPFIYGANELRCTPYPKTPKHNINDIVSVEHGMKLGGLISNGYTTGIDGQWSITRTDSYAVQHYISKQKYYTLERDWYYDPEKELEYRMNFAAKGREYDAVTYVGYEGEDITDRIHIYRSFITMNSREVDGVRIAVSPKGVFTTLRFYRDAYC